MFLGLSPVLNVVVKVRIRRLSVLNYLIILQNTPNTMFFVVSTVEHSLILKYTHNTMFFCVSPVLYAVVNVRKRCMAVSHWC